VQVALGRLTLSCAWPQQDVVFLHRSWTGHGIYEARFAPAEDGGQRIVRAVIESDRERYRAADEEYDCE
jgi:hypothetical protein